MDERLTEPPPECYIINNPVFAYFIAVCGKDSKAKLQFSGRLCIPQ
jgi:hypothetical protein